MTDFTIENPPPTNTGPSAGITADAVAFCQANPSQWVRVATGLRVGTAQGRKVRLKAAGCESTGRKLEDGTYAVWARWTA